MAARRIMTGRHNEREEKEKEKEKGRRARKKPGVVVVVVVVQGTPALNVTGPRGGSARAAVPDPYTSREWPGLGKNTQSGCCRLPDACQTQTTSPD